MFAYVLRLLSSTCTYAYGTSYGIAASSKKMFHYGFMDIDQENLKFGKKKFIDFSYQSCLEIMQSKEKKKADWIKAGCSRIRSLFFPARDKIWVLRTRANKLGP